MNKFDFSLDEHARIVLTVPSLPDKCNYYCEPREKLHKFDEGTVNFIFEHGKIRLKEDIVNEIAGTFFANLKNVLNDDQQLQSDIEVGCAGYILNKYFHDRSNRDIRKLLMWSSGKSVATLLYKRSRKIYLEIVPLYPWLFKEPDPRDNYVAFDKFMKTYKPYVVEVVPIEKAIKWQKQCEDILKKIDSNFLQEKQS